MSAQGDACLEATEFCPFGNQDAVTFPAGVNNPSLSDGNDYGCLATTPNPAWYYLEIGIAGSIDIMLTNSNNEDIDFALWGPFENLEAAFDSCGSLNTPFDCSYSPTGNELVSIGQVQVGEAYLLLITNFSNAPTDISGEASGSGEIACCTLALDSGESCEVSSEFSAYCWNTGLDLKLMNTGGELPADFCGAAESYRWASFEAFGTSSSVEISSENCTQIPDISAQLFSACDGMNPHSECLEMNENTTAFLANEAGSPNLDFTIGETYSLLIAGSALDTCAYRVTIGEAIPTAPIFSQDTLVGSFSICPNDTVTYALPMASDADSFEIEFSDMNAEIVDISLDSFTVYYANLAGDLCVTAINEVGTTNLCQTVILLPESVCETSVSVQTSENLLDYSLQIVPNPVRAAFRFYTKDVGATWEVINVAGQILESGKVGGEMNLVSVQNLLTGTYFLRVKGEKVAVEKFVLVD